MAAYTVKCLQLRNIELQGLSLPLNSFLHMALYKNVLVIISRLKTHHTRPLATVLRTEFIHKFSTWQLGGNKLGSYNQALNDWQLSLRGTVVSYSTCNFIGLVLTAYNTRLFTLFTALLTPLLTFSLDRESLLNPPGNHFPSQSVLITGVHSLLCLYPPWVLFSSRLLQLLPWTTGIQFPLCGCGLRTRASAQCHSVSIQHLLLSQQVNHTGRVTKCISSLKTHCPRSPARFRNSHTHT